MFNKISVHAVVGLLLAMVAMPAAYAANTRVAFVNVPKVLEEAPQAVAANKRLEKEFEPRNKSLIGMRKDLRDLEDRLAREGVTMSDAQLRQLEEEVRNLKREIRRTQEDYREDLNIRRNDELRRIQKKVYETIVQLAKEEKYDLVVGDGVIYAGDSIDITEKVLELLDKEFEPSSPSP